MKEKKIYMFVFLFVFSFIFFTLNALNNKESLIKQVIKDEPKITVIAIGDSLTEGVGNDNSGYMNYLKSYLKESYKTRFIKIYNEGKSGDKTQQITNRINDNLDIQKKIKDSNIILITTGGNDLIDIIRKNIFNDFTIETVKSNLKKYTSDLELLYKIIRDNNSNSIIFQLGIYNPFYYNFKEISEMQEIVELWNNTSKNVIKNQKNSYFIEINEEIYKGSGFSNQNINDLLSNKDSFHPNDKGYKIIANEFKKEIEKRFEYEKK